MIPALLKWIGSKQRSAETIVSYMPDTFRDYYEPFLGSGAVMAELLNADAAMLYPHVRYAYGSDILPFLIGIFDLTKDSPQELIAFYEREISEYYHNPPEKYIEIRDRFNASHNPYDFLLLSRTCYSGVIRFQKADGHQKNRHPRRDAGFASSGTRSVRFIPPGCPGPAGARSPAPGGPHPPG